MSTAGLFKPSRPDGRADWRVVFDLFDSLQPGEEIDHAKLMTALETDDRNRLYRAVAKANRKLWIARHRSVAVVKGTGYRMLRAEEHEAQAGQYRQQSRKRMSDAVAVMDATDLDALSDQQREWIVKVQTGFHILARAMDAHADRIAKHDDLISKLQSRVERLEGES